MDKIEIPKFDTKEELFEFLKENKSILIKQKTTNVKYADSVSTIGATNVDKAAPTISADATTIQVKSVINTTKVMDSHSDVHIDGLWKKTLKETKDIMLLQEHQMSFDKVISTDVKASTENIPFKTLGFSQLKGDTQALVFDSTISKDVNPYMFGLYAKGMVKNHSVGMRYVKIEMAVNSDDSDYKAEKSVWDKYIGQVANVKDAESQGYFFAVTEAKVIEGSAVLMGSNRVTPTLSAEQKDIEPPSGTQTEPLKDTQTDKKRYY
jgi:hypothetical protein